MLNIISTTFNEYAGSRANFETFHNQVINMPRDAFSTADLNKPKSLASYLLLIEERVPRSGVNYKEVMKYIIEELQKGNCPLRYRDRELENRYFRSDQDIDTLYNIQGRMFRHLMGLCAFFNIISSRSRQRKLIDFDYCRELIRSEDSLSNPIHKNDLLSCNINSNDFINQLKGVTIRSEADYRPAYSIIKYIQEIDRPATPFEVSVLLGRIDPNVQKEQDILSRAITIGNQLPKTQDEQIDTFFRSLDWKTDETHLFEYASSQQPYFKFKTFLLYMKQFDLININTVTNSMTLTKYALDLLTEEVPVELADLEYLLSQIDDDDESENLLADLIIRKRTSAISEAIRSDSDLVKKMNKRSLRNVVYDKRGKKKRNRIIAELAKIIANYTCEATGEQTFRTPRGLYYVEAHHIIHFNQEEGPDITDNLLALGPEKHRLIHLACEEEIDDLYNHLKTNGKLSYERFERFHNDYRCLIPDHVRILFDKKLISSIDRDRLLALIAA